VAEHESVNRGKQKDLEQKHRTRQQQSQPSSDAFHAWDDGQSALLETPFIPRIEEHVAILSRIPFSVQRHEFIMRLHKTYGNRYVQRLMESMNVQAKLSISDPNDVHEQEADRVADAVTRAINSPVQHQEEEEEVQMISDSQRQEEEEEVQMTLVLQRQEEEEELLQGEPLIQRQEEEEEELQTEPDASQLTQISDNIESRVDKARGSGQPLTDDVREPMERAFGADFSGVRTHTDAEADMLSKQLSARAFTTGRDVFFREGEYSPGSDSGRKLIAHELTHVVQQNGNGATPKTAVGQSYGGIPPYLRQQLTQEKPDVEPYKMALKAFRQKYSDFALESKYSSLCERPEIGQISHLSPLQRIRIQCRGEPQRDAYFNRANLGFTTLDPERGVPTLYFDDGSRRGRIRQVHEEGAKVQDPDARERRFVTEEQWLWARRRRNRAQLIEQFPDWPAVPSDGSRLIERLPDGRFHVSGGVVSTDIPGEYTDKAIFDIVQNIR